MKNLTQLEYKSNFSVIRRYLTLIILIILFYSFFYFILSDDIPNNYNFWDYEGFDLVYVILVFVTFSFLYNIIIFFLNRNRSERIVFREDKLIVDRDNTIHIPYDEVTHFKTHVHRTTIHTKDQKFTLLNNRVKNLKDINNMMAKKLKLKHVDDIKGKRLNIFWNIFIVILVFSSSFSNGKVDAYLESIKYYLPLQKIDTVTIEGILDSESSIYYYNRPKRKYSKQASTKFSLEAYPNIHFQYQNNNRRHHLKDEIINLRTDDYDKDKNLEKKHHLAAGSKIKIKIRPSDYENLQFYINSGQHLKKENKRDPQRKITFYELSVNDEILLQKFGIK